MITRILMITAMLALTSTPAFGSIANSSHDIGGSKLCESCHVPHNATQSDKLWAGTVGTGYTAIGNLCWTCHNSSGIANTISVDVMNSSLENHIMGSSSSITDCSGGNSCHDVHTQNPNGTGKFLRVLPEAGSYCRPCHNGEAPNTGPDLDFSAADILGDHTDMTINHLAGGVTCEDCHDVHGAPLQTAAARTVILRVDNSPAYWGVICLGCHETGAVGYNGEVSADQADYAQAINDGTETTHPTTATTAGAHDEIIGGCNACHDPHGTGNLEYYLIENNANSAFCVSCHSAGGDGPDVGASTHPTPDMSSQSNLGSSAPNPMPWATGINEDGRTGPDWGIGGIPNLMVCETCHSVHGRGTGPESDHFLRNDNSDNQMCTYCHAN